MDKDAGVAAEAAVAAVASVRLKQRWFSEEKATHYTTHLLNKSALMHIARAHASTIPHQREMRGESLHGKWRGRRHTQQWLQTLLLLGKKASSSITSIPGSANFLRSENVVCDENDDAAVLYFPPYAEKPGK